MSDSPQVIQSAEVVAQPSGWQIYRRLLSYTRVYWLAAIVGIIGFMMYASTQLVWAELFKYIVEAIEQGDAQAKNWVAISIVMTFFIRGIGSFLGVYGIAYVARHVVHRLRLDMYSKMLYLKSDYYHHNPSGRILSKMTFDVEQVSGACSDALKTLLQEGFTVVGLMIYLVYSHWKLALIFFAVGPLVGLVVNYASKRLSILSHKIQGSMGDVSHVVAETTQSYQTIKVYQGEDYESERFFKTSANNLKQSLKLVTTQALNTPIVQFLVSIALSLLVWLALQPEIFGDTTTGEFLAFITAAAMLAKPVRQLTQVNTVLQQGIAGAKSVFALLDIEGELNSGSRAVSNVTGALSFKGVEFRYPGQEYAVLKNINLEIKPGEKVALVGRSGSGKTTLTQLIARFELPSKGELSLDGIPLEAFKLSNLRQHMALVSQENRLFHNTVYHNIAYGALREASEQAVCEVLEQVHAQDFIEELPDGIDTVVGGEQGVQLSGGQQQRIALARALLKQAPIIILDEATSALDQETEKGIQEALNTVLKNRTAIIIAHRLSTIESADRILVLEDGEIVEQGNHAALIKRNGAYARLYQAGLAEA